MNNEKIEIKDANPQRKSSNSNPMEFFSDNLTNRPSDINRLTQETVRKSRFDDELSSIKVNPKNIDPVNYE